MIPEASIQQAYGAPPQVFDGQLPEGTIAEVMAEWWEQQFVFVNSAPLLVDVTTSTGNPGGHPKWMDQGIAIEIDPRDADVYVRFRADQGAPGTTPFNGRRIPAKTITVFWLPGPTFRYMDIVSTIIGCGVAYRRSSMARVLDPE